jgi:hypothetical protein
MGVCGVGVGVGVVFVGVGGTLNGVLLQDDKKKKEDFFLSPQNGSFGSFPSIGLS